MHVVHVCVSVSVCECERKTANKIKQVTVKRTGKLQGWFWGVRNLWGYISAYFAPLYKASWEVRGWALRIYKTKEKDKTSPRLGLDPSPGTLSWGDHPASTWQVRALAFSPAQLLWEPWCSVKPFALWISACSGKVNTLPGFKWWDAMWMAKGGCNSPLLAGHSLCVCHALVLSSFSINETCRTVTDNYPSPCFYCYWKMPTKYLGNEAWQTFRIGRVRFWVGERA